MLGWPAEDTEDGDVVLRAPGGAGPDWLFVAVPEDKVVKNRIHFDFTPDDQQAEIDRAARLGRPARGHRPGGAAWVVLADPEGNEFCILAADD